MPSCFARIARSAVLAFAVVVACRETTSAPRPAVTEGHDVHRDAAPTAPRVSPPAIAPAIVSDTCAPPPPPQPGDRWNLVGYKPGPALREVVSVTHHRDVLVGATAREVCVSDDAGASWARASGVDAGLALPVPHELPGLDALAVVAQGTDAEPATPKVFVSFERGGRWDALALPQGVGEGARVRTDDDRTLWLLAGTRLWWSDDGRAWQGPKSISGAAVDQFDACGAVLVARITRNGERYFYRSEDRGASWRPLRLGHLGIDGGDGVVRCLRWRGGIEAGRGLVPTHWSFDAGRTWSRALYDDKARTAARALAEDPRFATDPPRCMESPHGELACVDLHRLVLGLDGSRVHEIVAPAGCERVRLIDDHRVLAFGPACGVYQSVDRGGVWRGVTVSVDPERARRAAVAGRGGFVSADAVWRVDDGLWWSDDAGAHWRLVLTAATRALSWGVFTDRRHGVFVRDDGWVVSTRDGGDTWAWVIHEEVERLASAGSWLMLTTASRVRVSPDGGETWRASLPFPQDLRLDPVLQMAGSRRTLDITPAVRITQSGGAIELGAPTRNAATTTVVRNLPPAWDILAAHATGGAVDRVLLAGGTVLTREPDRANVSGGASHARHHHHHH